MKMKISQKIIDYAIWYYLKYYPSPRKLRFKLNEKFGPNSEKGKEYGGISEDEIDYIVTEKLRNILAEKEVIRAKIRNYKNKGKSRRYVLNKMFERMEDKKLVNIYINEEFTQDDENENLKKELIKQKYSDKLEYKEKQKIIRRILSKGYNYDNLQKIINLKEYD